MGFWDAVEKGVPGASLAGGGGLSDDKGSGSKKRKKQIREGSRVLETQIRPAFETSYAASLEHLLRGREAAEEGYNAALRETSNLGATSARRILEERRRRQAEIGQATTSRGLSGTTLGAQAIRGLESDTARALSDNAARFASLRANLYTGKGAALAAAESDLSQFYRLRFDTESRNILDRYFQLWTTIEAPAPSTGAQTGAALGATLGFLVGGPVGGVVGGVAGAYGGDLLD